MIGVINQRWLERRAQHLEVAARRAEWQRQTDAAIAARRAGRKNRSVRSAKGWPTRVHDAFRRDALINREVAR